VLREQIRLAYLLAGRNTLTRDARAVEVGDEAHFGSALTRDELHLKPVAGSAEDQDVSRLEAIERTAGALTGMFRTSQEASAARARG
jgi:hypothetical protein